MTKQCIEKNPPLRNKTLQHISQLYAHPRPLKHLTLHPRHSVSYTLDTVLRSTIPLSNKLTLNFPSAQRTILLSLVALHPGHLRLKQTILHSNLFSPCNRVPTHGKNIQPASSTTQFGILSVLQTWKGPGTYLLCFQPKI